jgi:hypothetical protein
MQESSTIHVPFAELSTAHRFFYWIAANTAIGLLRPYRPSIDDIGADIVRIWDEQTFTPADTLDISLLADRLKPYLEKYAAKNRRTKTPEQTVQRRRKN